MSLIFIQLDSGNEIIMHTEDIKKIYKHSWVTENNTVLHSYEMWVKNQEETVLISGLAFYQLARRITPELQVQE